MKLSHKLDEENLNALTNLTGRSNGQTQFLFQLVDGDFKQLKKLESQLKNCFYSVCPADKEEVNRAMKLVPRMNKYNF